ncbi:MAG: hypothetical protein KGL39_04315 [Patescibacteria group bacterium]|nr:hypothetical protein [Patescibacteria group bacterium]
MIAAASSVSVSTWLLGELGAVIVGMILTWVFRTLIRSSDQAIEAKFERIIEKTDQTLKQVTPNGGNTDSNGDLAKRTLRVLEEHIGTQTNTNERIYKAIRSQEKKWHRKFNALETQFETLNQVVERRAASRLPGKEAQ